MKNVTTASTHAALSVDCAIFGYGNKQLQVLLIDCDHTAYPNQYSLIGDLVKPNENLRDAAHRVLLEKTTFKDVYLEQVKAFGDINRHPEARVVTVAYYSLLKIEDYRVHAPASTDAKWIPLTEANKMAFDHDRILKACLNRLRAKLRTDPLGFELLPPKFTLSNLQNLYEVILNTTLDKRNFRKKILSMNLLEDCQEFQEGVAHRPARLYRFNADRYKQFLKEGFSFAV